MGSNVESSHFKCSPIVLTVVQLTTDVTKVRDLTFKVYTCIDLIARTYHETGMSKSDSLEVVGLLYKDKIHCLRFLWKRNDSTSLNITADIALCIRGEIVKYSRHFESNLQLRGKSLAWRNNNYESQKIENWKHRKGFVQHPWLFEMVSF